MRLLIIITPFSPAQTPNTLRWQPLIDYFLNRGAAVSVLTTLFVGQPIEEEINNVKVYRVGHSTLLDKLHSIFGSRNNRNTVNSSGRSYGLFSKLTQGLVDKLWRNNYWPDGSSLFMKPGIKQGLEIVLKEDISHVISVGLPFTCHWIAKHLKEQYPALHWHMDIEDPFCYSKEFWVNNFSKYEQKNLAAEKTAFELSDSISATNSKAMEKYVAYFGFAESKLSVIPPLFHRGEEDNRYAMILDPSKIHLAYCGSFYEGVRSPKLFLDFIKELHSEDSILLDKVQFHFIGQLDRFSHPLIRNYSALHKGIVLHGFKTRAETLAAMSQVDILMNFGNTTNYHLPSKVVDYLYANKPIVNFISIVDDSTKVFLEGYDRVLNLYLEKANFHRLGKRFKEFIYRDYPPAEIDTDRIDNYSVSSIGNKYLNQLKNM